ncbi:hypothetical protein Leryth_026639 [Lithospermum erythrorhizon]|nr:hypothetical protein Leryth_026639 [Lithospermum erythrorhizon]
MGFCGCNFCSVLFLLFVRLMRNQDCLLLVDWKSRKGQCRRQQIWPERIIRLETRQKELCRYWLLERALSASAIRCLSTVHIRSSSFFSSVKASCRIMLVTLMSYFTIACNRVEDWKVCYIWYFLDRFFLHHQICETCIRKLNPGIQSF